MQLDHIAIVGAGAVGAALGRRFATSGLAVTFGVRDVAKTAEVVAACPGARAASPREAAESADVVVLAVPAGAALEAAASLGDLGGKILIDCNNPLRWDEGPVWSPPEEGSLSAALAARVPAGAHGVKAFNTFGAEFHADPSLAHGEAADVPIAADDAEAGAAVAELARSAGFVPVDAGPLRNAAVLENVAMLWIHLALAGGQGRDFAFKMLRR
jgi:hypothetical protein